MSTEGRMFLRLLADAVVGRMKSEDVPQRWSDAYGRPWWTEMMVGSSTTRSAPKKDFGALGDMAERLGYTPQAEYLRIDQIWYFVPNPNEPEWIADAYLEHENDSRKLLELVRKLLNISGGLKVVITYPSEERREDLLDQVGTLISARYGVSDDMRLLVVFGFLGNADIEWEGYMFDGRGRRISLHGVRRIRGA